MASGSSVSMTQVCGCVAALAVGSLLLVLVASEVQEPVYRYLVAAAAAAAVAAAYLRLR